MTQLSYNPDVDGFDYPSEGRHHGVCCDIWDMGLVDTRFGKRELVRIYWQIDETQTSGKFRGEPHLVAKNYTKSLHPNSNLRRDLEMWRGQPFEDGDLTIDLEELIGKRCTIDIVHNKQGNAIFANVDKVFRAAKANTMEVSKNYIRKYIREMQPEPNSDASTGVAPNGWEEEEFSFDPDDDLPF